jgi:hypothetical protein
VDPIEILDLVTRGAGLDAAYHVTTFKGYRPTDTSGGALTTVEVWDRGVGASRFTVLARDELGRSATGDPQPTLDQAMTAVPWSDLDQEPSMWERQGDERGPRGRWRGSRSE